MAFSRTEEGMYRARITNGEVEMAFVGPSRDDAGDLAIAMWAHLRGQKVEDIADAVVVTEPENVEETPG